MKEKWEIKKLGEVCLIQRGGSPRPINEYITDSDNGLNWIKIGDTTPNSRYITKTAEKIKSEGLSKTRFVHKGDFLLSNSMSFGRPYILEIDGCIHDGWLVIHDKNEIFNKSYLYFLLSSPIVKSKFELMAVGGVVNNLNTTMVSNLEIPIPPLPVQEAIVKELDTLHRIKELQEQQLAEYDTLAQATFYDMFGDPIENEKGWEMKKLGEVCEIVRGGSPRPISKFLGGTIPWIKIGDATSEDSIYLHSTKEHIISAGISKSRLIPAGSMIFANCGVSLGFSRIITFEGCIHDGWLAFNNIDEKIYHKVFLLKLLNTQTDYFRRIAPDGTQPNLNTAIMKKLEIIQPPLNIQSLYTERIEKIEAQKQLVKQGIAETQTLIDYTMDKYFG